MIPAHGCHVNPSNLNAALQLAAAGYAVFPCHWITDAGKCSCGDPDCGRWEHGKPKPNGSPGKHPIGTLAKHGCKDATKDPRIITDWWTKCPQANVAIATGAPSGKFVLDVEADGWEDLNALQQRYGTLPTTATVQTGSGGWHPYFLMLPGIDVRNGQHVGGYRMDVRGTDGYVIAPPSNHYSGGVYSWITNCPVAAASDWLVEFVTSTGRFQPQYKHPTGPGVSVPAPGTTPQDVLARASAYLDKVPPAVSGQGGHDQTITAALVLVRGFAIPPADAWPIFQQWNQRCVPPWPNKDLWHKLTDADRDDPGVKWGAEPRGFLLSAGSVSASSTGTLVTVRGDEIVRQQLEWLWGGRVPIGKLTRFVGDPGLGKSLVTLNVAAAVTRGDLPGDRQGTAGRVLIFSAEDDPADTIMPRLDEAGADPSRIQIMEAVRDDGRERCFNLERDIPRLEEEFCRLSDYFLLIIDPESAASGKIDTHRDADVRGMLAPLAKLMQSRRIACVSVGHLNKGAGGKALYRATGSVAFAAAARSMWSFSSDPDDSSRMLMLPVKNNLAAPPTGLAYRVVPGRVAPRIAWEANPVMQTANELLAVELERQDGRGREWREAAEWLTNELSQGPVPAADLIKSARANGIKDKPLRTAREKLDVQTIREGFGPGAKYLWHLPGTQT